MEAEVAAGRLLLPQPAAEAARLGNRRQPRGSLRRRPQLRQPPRLRPRGRAFPGCVRKGLPFAGRAPAREAALLPPGPAQGDRQRAHSDPSPTRNLSSRDTNSGQSATSERKCGQA